MTPSNVRRRAEERRLQATAIGGRIRQLRLARGWSQETLAAGRYTKAYISALETGNARPSMAALHHIAAAIGVPPEELLREPSAGETVALPATIRRARIADGRVYAELHDGRDLGLPISRSRRLSRATAEQLDGWEVIEFGRVLRWPGLGEEISLDEFLGVRVLLPSEVAGTLSREAATGAAASPPRRGSGRAARRDAGGSGRYRPLVEWLVSRPGEELRLSFADVERATGAALPPRRPIRLGRRSGRRAGEQAWI